MMMEQHTQEDGSGWQIHILDALGRFGFHDVQWNNWRDDWTLTNRLCCLYAQPMSRVAAWHAHRRRGEGETGNKGITFSHISAGAKKQAVDGQTRDKD